MADGGSAEPAEATAATSADAAEDVEDLIGEEAKLGIRKAAEAARLDKDCWRHDAHHAFSS